MRVRGLHYHLDDHFSVMLWEGSAGDYVPIRVADGPMMRSEFACFTVLLRGAMVMVSPSEKELWKYRVGSTSDDGGDFMETGTYHWTMLSPVTQELCFGRLDSNGKESDEPFRHRVERLGRGSAVAIPGYALIVVTKGGVDSAKGVFRAPYFLMSGDAGFHCEALEDGTEVVVVEP